MAQITVWFCFVRSDFSQVSETGFVDVDEGTRIAELREMAKEKSPAITQGIDAMQLVVWKLVPPISVMGAESKDFSTFKTVTGNADVPPDATGDVLRKLSAVNRVMSRDVDGWPEDFLHILVQLPKDVSNVEHGVKHARDSLDDAIPLLKRYEDIAIRFPEVTDPTKFSVQNLEYDNILRWARTEKLPTYVEDMHNKLKKERNIGPSVSKAFQTNVTAITARYITAALGEDETLPQARTRDETLPQVTGSDEVQNGEEAHSESPAQSYDSKDGFELSHVAILAFWRWNQAQTMFTEDMARETFFNPIRNYVERCNASFISVSVTTGSWKMGDIILHYPSEPPGEQFRKYRPRSDFSLERSNFPWFLLEFQSQTGPQDPNEYQPDLVRLLLQAGFVVRFANLDSPGRTFVLVVQYVYRSGVVDRYYVFQSDDDESRTVYYYKLEPRLPRNLLTQEGSIDSVREIYNLIEVIISKGEGDRNAIENFSNALTSYKKQHGMKSLHTRAPTAGGAQGAAGGKAPQGAGGNNRRGGEADQMQELDEGNELIHRGYEIIPDIYEDSKGGRIESFNPFPDNILRLTHSKDKKAYIAKKIRERSNEAEFLEFIKSCQQQDLPGSQHIITMHETFTTRSATVIILPYLPSIGSQLQWQEGRKLLAGHAVTVCWDLCDGVGFLHKQLIAHRDIKPDNLVFGGDFCVKIIDFDIALQLNAEDEEGEESCGTEGWQAPEMERVGGMVSPIKCDRWACGRTVLHLLGKTKVFDKLLDQFATELCSDVPANRPSLIGWRQWRDDRLAAQHAVPLHPRPRPAENGDQRKLKRRRETEADGGYQGLTGKENFAIQITTCPVVATS